MAYTYCVVLIAILVTINISEIDGSTMHDSDDYSSNQPKLNLNILESKLTIENENIRKENERLQRFLVNSKYLEESTSNNIDLVSFIETEEKAPKILCEKFAYVAIKSCRAQYVDCIKRSAGATEKKLTARAIRREAEIDPKAVEESDKLQQAAENSGEVFLTPLQRREKAAKIAMQPKPFMTLQPNAMIPPPSTLANIPLNKEADPEKAIVDSTKKMVKEGAISPSDKKKIDADVLKNAAKL